MWYDSVYSDGSKYFVSNPLPKKGEEITIYIRFSKKVKIDCVFIKTKLNGIDRACKMEKSHEQNGLVYYKYNVVCYEDVLKYQFLLFHRGTAYYYTQNGITTFFSGRNLRFQNSL
mgnify:FL=1